MEMQRPSLRFRPQPANTWAPMKHPSEHQGLAPIKSQAGPLPPGGRGSSEGRVGPVRVGWPMRSRWVAWPISPSGDRLRRKMTGSDAG